MLARREAAFIQGSYPFGPALLKAARTIARHAFRVGVLLQPALERLASTPTAHQPIPEQMPQLVQHRRPNTGTPRRMKSLLLLQRKLIKKAFAVPKPPVIQQQRAIIRHVLGVDLERQNISAHKARLIGATGRDEVEAPHRFGEIAVDALNSLTQLAQANLIHTI